MNLEFNRLVDANKTFFESAASGNYTRELGYVNLTPENLEARERELTDLIVERRFLENARDLSKLGTQQKDLTWEVANRLLSPINTISKDHFRGTQHETNLYLNRRYTRQTAGEAGVASGKELKPKSRAAHAELARFTSILETLETMPDEDRQVYTDRGITPEHLAEFRKWVEAFQKAHSSKPALRGDWVKRSDQWTERKKAYMDWWREICRLMKAHMNAQNHPTPKATLNALAMEPPI